jgi:hypothetical protein
MLVGEGKPENQNHAIIFTRGEAILRKTASFFERFPYVCPEPVLAK